MNIEVLPHVFAVITAMREHGWDVMYAGSGAQETVKAYRDGYDLDYFVDHDGREHVKCLVGPEEVAAAAKDAADVMWLASCSTEQLGLEIARRAQGDAVEVAVERTEAESA